MLTTTDSKNNKIKNGDYIQTERGAVLQVLEKNNEFYIKNEFSDSMSLLSFLRLSFTKVNKTKKY